MSFLSRRPSAQTRAPGSGYSLFDSQLTVTGDIETDGSVRIDGRMFGNIRRADTVVIGVGATMTGNINARDVVIGGTLTGNLSATDRVELQPTAIVTGDVITQLVLVQEGGVVNGRVDMRSLVQVPAPAATTEHSFPAGRR
jgi:cytoskeletal protein CcmA (bactofilin family)